MKLTFKGNSKEIAELVLQLQPRSQPELPKQNHDSSRIAMKATALESARLDSIPSIKPPPPPETTTETATAQQTKPFYMSPPMSPGISRPKQPPTTNKELYKIECNCDTEYFAHLFENTTKLRCKECNQTVFVDRFAPKKISDYGKEATLATNRYRVAFIEGGN